MLEKHTEYNVVYNHSVAKDLYTLFKNIVMHVLTFMITHPSVVMG